MKILKTIRKGTFETNSSSTHSMTICTKSEYKKWENGELLFDRYDEKLVNPKDIKEQDDYRYLTYEKYSNDEDRYYLEGYKENYTTPSGDEIVIFGEYGYDG